MRLHFGYSKVRYRGLAKNGDTQRPPLRQVPLPPERGATPQAGHGLRPARRGRRRGDRPRGRPPRPGRAPRAVPAHRRRHGPRARRRMPVCCACTTRADLRLRILDVLHGPRARSRMTGTGSGHDADAGPQAEPGASPRTTALAGRQGSAVGWLAGKERSQRPETPPRSSGEDRRPLPLRVLSPQARQGSAAPTATPRRRARIRCRRQATPPRQPRRRAGGALALDPPLPTSHARTTTLPDPDPALDQPRG